MSGTLYIVATPIGNLEDLTPRARQTLEAVDLIAAEDTRHTGRLLSHIGAKTPQMALHDHNESSVVGTIINKLKAGDDVALVSDAGMPLVSDPGYHVVKTAHENGIRVSPIPGASAVTAALAASGLPSDRFTFEGFLPARKASRTKALKRLSNESRTMVFFESVHRIAESLHDLATVFGSKRAAFIGRELSKLHEQCVPGTLGSLMDQVTEKSITTKGEFVIVVAGTEPTTSESIDVDRLLSELAVVLPGKQAATIAAKVTGARKNALYARVLELKLK
ncbi:MAG: 16S rRNA (cytidine(1402)-2'-O)-methyltransferase [Gammaproteobacteria bacterium]|nr:16S rRNA (cytidine(1402)-2'-O)-methyltransferase [Gammaproteobacteria bacterium]